MKQLIVNADDFGYSFGINKGIIEAHNKGIVTSTSVLVDSTAAHEATHLLEFPDLSIGLHFELIEVKNVENELTRQIEKFISIVGKNPDHIDTHKRHPTDDGIKDVLIKYSIENNIPVRGLGHVKHIDTFFGFHSNGNVSVAQLKKAIDQATEDFNEIMCHVGFTDDYLRDNSSYNDPREQELATICDPDIMKYVRDKELKLCNWREVNI